LFDYFFPFFFHQGREGPNDAKIMNQPHPSRKGKLLVIM